MRRGLAREDLFTVAADVVMTDSLAYADIVLPASSHFEYADLYAAYGQHWLQRAEPVIPPQGDSLPNTEIFRRLAARFGFTDPIFRATDAELMDDAVDAADPRMRGLTGSRVPLSAPLAMDGRRRAGHALRQCPAAHALREGRARLHVSRGALRRAAARATSRSRAPTR